MISYDEAYKATNPADDEDTRKKSALAIVAGTAANDAYWNSRTQLEALQARADGHGAIVRGADTADGNPTVVGLPTAAGSTTETQPTAIDATAEEVPSTDTGATGSAPATDSSDAVAKLRAQLEAANITPEA